MGSGLGAQRLEPRERAPGDDMPAEGPEGGAQGHIVAVEKNFSTRRERTL